MRKKTILLKITAFAVFAFTFHNCEMDPVNNLNDSQPGKMEAGGVSFDCLQGILQFNTHDDFIAAANYLNGTDIYYHKHLFQDVGFKSQEMILHEISIAEEIFDNEYYKGIDEDISVDDLIKTGLGIEYSPLFNSYLEKGFIRVLKEEDGSESYYPSTINPSLMSVLSKDGFVIVNGLLMHYTDRNIKFVPFKTMDQMALLNATAGADTEKGISAIEFETTLKGYVTHKDTTASRTKGSKLRVSSRYAIWDGDVHGQYFDPAEYVYINHIIELKAEEKRWGKWKIRNNYTPLCGLNASWETCLKFGTYLLCDITQSGAGVKNSPVYENPFSFGCTNYYKFNPSPVGWINYSGELYHGIISGYWNLEVEAANIDDPNNSGSY